MFYSILLAQEVEDIFGLMLPPHCLIAYALIVPPLVGSVRRRGLWEDRVVAASTFALGRCGVLAILVDILWIGARQ